MGLVDNLSGNCAAIEEKEIQIETQKIIDSIEFALGAYNEKEGIEVIQNNAIKLEEMINNYL